MLSATKIVINVILSVTIASLGIDCYAVTSSPNASFLIGVKNPDTNRSKNPFSSRRNGFSHNLVIPTEGLFENGVADNLQHVLNMLNRGETKMLQVIRVPAVYEIHLQNQDSAINVPVKWPQSSPTTYHNSFYYKPSTSSENPLLRNGYYRSQAHNHGKYPHPRPFGFSDVRKRFYSGSKGQLSSDLYRRSNSRLAPREVLPDLSLYYAKKKEIDDINYKVKRNYNEKISARQQRRIHVPQTDVPSKINFVVKIKERRE